MDLIVELYKRQKIVMKLKNFPLLFLTFLAISYTHEQFDQYIDRWNLIANIEGSFDKNHTVFIFKIQRYFKNQNVILVLMR